MVGTHKGDSHKESCHSHTARVLVDNLGLGGYAPDMSLQGVWDAMVGGAVCGCSWLGGWHAAAGGPVGYWVTFCVGSTLGSWSGSAADAARPVVLICEVSASISVVGWPLLFGVGLSPHACCCCKGFALLLLLLLTLLPVVRACVFNRVYLLGRLLQCCK